MFLKCVPISVLTVFRGPLNKRRYGCRPKIPLCLDYGYGAGPPGPPGPPGLTGDDGADGANGVAGCPGTNAIFNGDFEAADAEGNAAGFTADPEDSAKSSDVEAFSGTRSEAFDMNGIEQITLEQGGLRLCSNQNYFIRLAYLNGFGTPEDVSTKGCELRIAVFDDGEMGDPVIAGEFTIESDDLADATPDFVLFTSETFPILNPEDPTFRIVVECDDSGEEDDIIYIDHVEFIPDATS